MNIRYPIYEGVYRILTIQGGRRELGRTRGNRDPEGRAGNVGGT